MKKFDLKRSDINKQDLFFSRLHKNRFLITLHYHLILLERVFSSVIKLNSDI